MGEPVNGDLRTKRRKETEARLIEAASELFLERGYAGTTLADVAARAGLAPRTVYVRFRGKADLLRRCIDIAIAGDADPVAIADRVWMAEAMTAPALDERIRLMSAITTRLMDQAGPLLDVAQQAAATEPDIAAAAQAGREDTRRTLQTFWRLARDDGLLPDRCDLEWLTETAAILAHAETHLLIQRTTGWDSPTYRTWLETTWTRLVAASTERPAVREP